MPELQPRWEVQAQEELPQRSGTTSEERGQRTPVAVYWNLQKG